MKPAPRILPVRCSLTAFVGRRHTAVRTQLLTCTIPSKECLAQYSNVFVPATPKNGSLPQPSILHFLFLTLTIPSGACCAQYFPVIVPATPKDGSLPQPSVLHFLFLTLTIPSGACCAQYSAVFVPATPKDGTLSKGKTYLIIL